MKTPVLRFILPLALLAACNNENEGNGTDKKAFISVLSYIKSQVAHVDTSLYSIYHITVVDSTRSDTVPVPREQFRSLAADFLEIPDISEKKYASRYTETKSFDEMTNRLQITYLPVDPEKELVQREDLSFTPDPTGDRFNSIFIKQLISNKDSSLEKILLWQPDRGFHITRIKQLPGEPETITRTSVVWNDPSNQ